MAQESVIAAPSANEPRINDRIRAREVRLVASDGQQIGIRPLPEALQLAREQDLDLVEVAPMANPPVCRIMDYGKFKYEESQKAKESRRKASNVSIKEMKYRPKIGPGDFDTKTRKIGEFLAEGHKVKVTIMFRGREVYHPELGMKILDQVAEAVAPVGKVEAAPKLDGRNMTMVLAPDRKAQQANRARSGEGATSRDGSGREASTPADQVPADAAESPPAPAANGGPNGDAASAPQPATTSSTAPARTPGLG